MKNYLMKKGNCPPEMAGSLLYKENHALDAWFNKAYGGE